MGTRLNELMPAALRNTPHRTPVNMPRSHPSRREFLTATGGMVLAGSAPAILGAANKSGSKPPVIGPEGHRYETHHDCMQIPSHICMFRPRRQYLSGRMGGDRTRELFEARRVRREFITAYESQTARIRSNYKSWRGRRSQPKQVSRFR